MISILKNKDGQLLPIYDHEKYVKGLNKSVDEFNIKMCNQIFELSNNHSDEIIFPPIIIKHDDITGLIVGKMMWRRCNAYIVIQNSDYSRRILVYFHDYINHSSESFGTNSILAAKDFSVINDKIQKCSTFYVSKYKELNEIMNVLNTVKILNPIDLFGL